MILAENLSIIISILELENTVFLLFKFLSTYSLFVRLLVEVIEQEVEHNGVQQYDPSKCLRVIAFDEQ